MRDRLAELGSPDDEAVEMEQPGQDGFMAPFFKTVKDIREGMTQIEKNIREIQEIHSQALAAYQTKKDQQSTQRLDDLMLDISAIGNKIRDQLKTMDKTNKQLEDQDPGSVNVRIRVSQHASVSKKFIEVMDEYNQVQTTYKKKYRERIQRQFKIVNMEATPEEVERILDGEVADDIFAQQILSQSSEEAKQRLEDIKDRHKDIVKLEKSIKELHELFMDMALLVSRQGEMIDQIEFTCGTASDYVGKAAVELRDARKIQKSVRKKQICLAVLILVLILVIVLPLVLRN